MTSIQPQFEEKRFALRMALRLPIVVSGRTDDGATWSGAVKVNNDKTSNAQFFPVVTVDPTTGYVFVSFLDCRNDPGNGSSSCSGPSTTTTGSVSAAVSSANGERTRSAYAAGVSTSGSL